MTKSEPERRNLRVVSQGFDHEEVLLSPPSHPVQLDLHEIAKNRGLITTGFHLPYDPRLVERARDLRRNMTPAEKKLWYEFLRGFRYPALRQRPIDHYIVDFYCARLKLIIEVDGDQHFTQEGKQYDEQRSKILESYGLRTLRFTNVDVMQHFEAVCEQIQSMASVSGRIPPSPPLARGVRGG